MSSSSVTVDPLTSLNFYTISADELAAQFKVINEPAFRVKQVREWVYDKGILDFQEMRNLPVGLRDKLTSLYHFGSLKLERELVSKDGTRKRAYALSDKQIIESVLMPYDDGRFTACVSSQAGCAMGCVFCATGQMGFFRQLTSTEIFEQVQKFSSELKSENKRLSNVVLMGMGEPFANYKNVMAAVRRMNVELGIGARHITISTVGLSPRIRKLADEDIQVGLAVSLHQTDDEARSSLMPVNSRYPIGELMDACRYYVSKTNRRITFEWALIKGETDSTQTAHDLGRLLEGLLCHVNVIPLNPTGGFDGKPTSKSGVDSFCNVLGEYGISATPRTRRGIDIDAGCGQLKSELVQKAKKERAALGLETTEVEGVDVEEERKRVFVEMEKI
jgi:23S rRNA (adenine2503-C2)-methyltransferase